MPVQKAGVRRKRVHYHSNAKAVEVRQWLKNQFKLEARINNTKEHPLLSCYDIQILLATTLPDRRYDSHGEVMRQNAGMT